MSGTYRSGACTSAAGGAGPAPPTDCGQGGPHERAQLRQAPRRVALLAPRSGEAARQTHRVAGAVPGALDQRRHRQHEQLAEDERLRDGEVVAHGVTCHAAATWRFSAALAARALGLRGEEAAPGRNAQARLQRWRPLRCARATAGRLRTCEVLLVVLRDERARGVDHALRAGSQSERAQLRARIVREVRTVAVRVWRGHAGGTSRGACHHACHPCRLLCSAGAAASAERRTGDNTPAMSGGREPACAGARGGAGLPQLAERAARHERNRGLAPRVRGRGCQGPVAAAPRARRSKEAARLRHSPRAEPAARACGDSAIRRATDARAARALHAARTKA